MDFVLNINLCRVCMKPKPGDCLKKNSDLKTKYCYTTQLPIDENDSLPTVICAKCVTRLNSSYDFIKLSRESHANLEQLVSRVNNVFEQATKPYADDKEEEENYSTNTSENEEFLPVYNEKEKSKTINKSVESGQTINNVTHTIEETLVEVLHEKTQVVELPSQEDIDYLVYGSKTAENNTLVDEQIYIENSVEDIELLRESNAEVHSSEYDALLEGDDAMCVEFNEDTQQSESRGGGGEDTPSEIRVYSSDDNISLLKPLSTENADSLDDVYIEEDFLSEELNDAKSKNTQIINKRRRYKKPSNGSEARFFCVKCNRDFSTRQNLNRHMITHEGNKPFVCAECGKSFSQNGSLKQHMLTHTGERPFVCNICDKGFTQWKCLVFHNRRHTGEKPFTCEHCKVSFRQKDGLKAHILKHHMTKKQLSGGKEAHVCGMCKVVLRTKKLLDEHMKQHLNKHKEMISMDFVNNKLSKEVINEILDDEITREIHAAIIEKNDDIEIDDGIASSTHVIDVVTTSASEPGRAKKYQCRKCFKCFAIVKNLIRHLTIHKENLHQCNKCNVSFQTEHALNHHRAIEHKEKGVNPYVCAECNEHFDNDQNLNEHLRIEHGFLCLLCPAATFKTKNDLLEHQIDHEEMQSNMLLTKPKKYFLRAEKFDEICEE